MPEDGLVFTAQSYDNTGELGANTWRHVAFVEQQVEAHDDTTDAMRWLMSSDVCKHCTHAACLDVCPTGALFRTEFGTVVVQEDVCNGCGYCIPACPFGVLDRREIEDDGRVWKCTLCYDRLGDGMTPACAKACPTESIQFGPLDELRERARRPARGAPGRGRAGRPPLRRRSLRRCRRLRRLLPAAGRARGVRPASRSGGHHPRPPRDVAGGRCGGAGAGRSGRALDAGKAAMTATDRTAHDSYYGRPILKEPVWKPEVGWYLFTGGLAGASASLVAGRPADRQPLAGTHLLAGGRRGRERQPAAAGQGPGPAGAVPEHAARVQADLADERRLVAAGRHRHRPERGHNL